MKHPGQAQLLMLENSVRLESIKLVVVSKDFKHPLLSPLFLGVYYGFGIINRIVFILVGALVALLFNLIRAFTLSMIKINGAGHVLDTPIYQLGNWVLPTLHDMVGWIENLLILLALFFLARLAKGGIILTSMGTNPSYWSNIRFSTPWPFQILTIIWITFTFFSSEFYYSAHEAKLENLPHISLTVDDPEISVEEQVISNQITAQLHYTDASSIRWQQRDRMIPKQIGSKEMIFNPNQEYWQAFEANWESGGACTAVLSTHSPSCLPSINWTATSQPPNG